MSTINFIDGFCFFLGVMVMVIASLGAIGILAAWVGDYAWGKVSNLYTLNQWRKAAQYIKRVDQSEQEG